MKIILSGGERSSYRSVLVKNHVPNIAINLTPFKVPTKTEFIINEQFGGAAVTLYASPEDTDLERYDEFIRRYEYDLSIIIGMPGYNGDWLGDKYYPVWNDPKDTERLALLMERYGRVAIPDKALTVRSLGRIRQLQQRWGASLLGLTSKTANIEALPWNAVIVTSWTSAVRYHEVQVWDGHGLRRYPAQNKVAARKQHRADIVRLGCDYDEIMEDSVDEAAKLAVLSWLEYEHKTFGTSTPAAYDPLAIEDDDEDETPFGGSVVAIAPESPLPLPTDSEGYSLATLPPDERLETERVLLPVVGIETMIRSGSEDDPDGMDIGDSERGPIPMLRSSGSNIRRCDSCYLSNVCPKFKKNASCAYELPVELKTKDQLRAVIRVILEIQTQRVIFETMAEQLEGQGASPTLSKEMDRLFNLIAAAKDIQDSRDLVKFTMEARTGPGAITSLFGPTVGAAQNQVANPLTTRELDAALLPIMDAEIVSDLET